jgi:hypothetical protein
MVWKTLPKSIRKYIRKEKARIRKEILDLKKQEEEIKKLYQKFLKQYEDKRNIQPSDKKGN